MRFGLKRKPAKLSRSGSTGGARAEFHVFFVLRALLVACFMHPSDSFKACRKKYYHRPPHRSDIEIAKTAALISRVEIQRANFFYIAIEKQIRCRLTPRSFSRVLA